MSDRRCRIGLAMQCIAATIFCICMLAPNANAEEKSGFTLKAPPKIAMVLYGRRYDGGWTKAFDDARLKLQDQLNTEIPYIDQVDERTAQVVIVVERFIAQGYNVIIGAAYGYSEAFDILAKKYPDVAFLNGSGTTNGPNLQSFYGRIYNSHYLCGMAAALKSKSGTLGYVAARNIGVVNWTVNGFAMGARRINPDAKIFVHYTGNWAEPVAERDATEELIADGADVIGEHVDTPRTQLIAQDAGVFGTGHHRDMSEYAPKATICSGVWIWDRYLYREILKIEKGNWKPEPDGALPVFADGPTDIVLNHALLTPEIIETVMVARQELIEGKDIFAGPLIDRDGKQIVGSGETLTTHRLWEMDWYMPGIEVHEAHPQRNIE